MCDPSIVSSLQQNIKLLQDKNNELEEQIQVLMEKNTELQSDAALANTLQQQIRQLIKEEAPKPNSMVLDFESEFIKQNEILRLELDKIYKERDSYMKDATQTKALKDLIAKKNQENIDLSRKLSEVSQQLAFYKAQSGNENPININIASNEALQPVMDDLMQQNSKLIKENLTLENRVTMLSKELAETKTLISVIQTENQVEDIGYILKDPERINAEKIKIVEERIKEMTDEMFSNISSKIRQLEEKLQNAQNQFKKISQKANSQANQDLLEENEYLKQELLELQESDLAPKLAVTVKKLKELEEENQRLRKFK